MQFSPPCVGGDVSWMTYGGGLPSSNCTGFCLTQGCGDTHVFVVITSLGAMRDVAAGALCSVSRCADCLDASGCDGPVVVIGNSGVTATSDPGIADDVEASATDTSEDADDCRITVGVVL